jgi:hypothetical protein
MGDNKTKLLHGKFDNTLCFLNHYKNGDFSYNHLHKLAATLYNG